MGCKLKRFAGVQFLQIVAPSIQINGALTCFFTESCKVTSFEVELQSRTLVHSSLVKMPLKRPHKSLALSKVSEGA